MQAKFITVDLQLPSHPRTEDQALNKELQWLYNAINTLAQKVIFGSLPVIQVVFNQAANPYDAVGLINVAGQAQALPAIIAATPTKGFYVGKVPINPGEIGFVQVGGIITFPTPILAAAAIYWTGAIAGTVTQVDPGAGNRQLLGYSVNSDQLVYIPDHKFT